WILLCATSGRRISRLYGALTSSALYAGFPTLPQSSPLICGGREPFPWSQKLLNPELPTRIVAGLKTRGRRSFWVSLSLRRVAAAAATSSPLTCCRVHAVSESDRD